MGKEIDLKPTHVCAPVNGFDVTKGRKYKIVSAGKLKFEIYNDRGVLCIFSFKNSSTIHGFDWVLCYEGKPKTVIEDKQEMSVAQIIAWVLFVIACVLSMCYLFSHRTNFQEVVPPYTDKGGSTLFIKQP
jgi:hypothetical protein